MATWDAADEQRLWVVEVFRNGKYVPTIHFGLSRKEARAQQKNRKRFYPNAHLRVTKYVPEV